MVLRIWDILEKSFLRPNAASSACETASIDAMNFHRASFGEDHLSGRVNFEREKSRGFPVSP